MAQTRKPEIEARILHAARTAFAERGYRGATIADIAARAELSTGNTYRYFESKDALFYRVVDDALADRLLALVRRRVASLASALDLSALPAPAQADAEALLRFWIEHRLEVVILLARAEGSRHEHVRRSFVDALLKPMRKLMAGGGKLSRESELVLATIFDNTVHALVAILERCKGEAQIRAAFSLFWSYQLGGLAKLRRRVQP
jgi:AcrR family transcriptional regulator